MKDYQKQIQQVNGLKEQAFRCIWPTQNVNKKLLTTYLKHNTKPIVLDIDATVMPSYKSIAIQTYKQDILMADI